MMEYKKKISQQLVEFLLVAPFMIIILGILTEYAYALNIDMVLNAGLKTVTSSVYGKTEPNMDKSSLLYSVESQLTNYLKSNSINVTSDNNLNVDYVILGTNAVFVANYTYISAFTLPNVYFHFLPEKFYFSASTSVPASFLFANGYDTAITPESLDKIWGNPSGFSSLTAFADTKKGLMKNKVTDSNTETQSIVFLIPVTTPDDASGQFSFYITRWNGSNWNNTTDKTQAYIANLRDGKIHQCNTTSCSPISNTSIMSNLSGVKTIIVYKGFLGNTTSKLSSLTCETKLLDGSCWVLKNSVSISDLTNDGILKNALALIDNVTLMNTGNFDKVLDVPTYNPGAASGNSYILDTFGSLVFIHTANDPIAKQAGYEGLIDPANSPPSSTFSSHFGTEMN